MNLRLWIPLVPLLLTACENSDREVQAAVREGLAVPDSARFSEIVYGKRGDIKYACATVDAKNRLGMSVGAQQIPLITDEKGHWKTLDPDEGQTSESCLKMLAADVAGTNDSVPPSSYTSSFISGASKGTNEASTTFNREEVRWFNSFGENVVQGEASLMSRSGAKRVCGSDNDSVSLIPVSTYARQRMKLIYGNDESGFRGSDSQAAPADPLYVKMMKEAGCDEQGRFLFENVPDGEYFVTASIDWKVHKRPPLASLQGGYLMKRVRVAGGQVVKISLTAR